MATNWPGGSALPRAHKKPWCKAKALREADKVRLLGAKIERDGTKYVPRVVRDKRGEPIRLFGGADIKDPHSPDPGERVQSGVTIRREGATLLQWVTGADRSVLVERTAPVCTVGAGPSREAIASLAPTLEDPTIRYGIDGLVDHTVRKYKDHDSISSVRKVTVLQRTHRNPATLF